MKQMHLRDSLLKEINLTIQNTFGESFYDAVISKGSPTLIKSLFKIKDYPGLINSYFGPFSKFILEMSNRFEEHSLDLPYILTDVNNIILQIQGFVSFIEEAEDSRLSIELLNNNFPFIEKEFIKKLNKVNNTNLSTDDLYINEETKLNFRSKIENRWIRAYKKNHEESLNHSFLEFEERVSINPFLHTLKYF